jgi:hypothetical protein
MNTAASVLAPATKALALGSLVLALGCGAWVARPSWHLLPHAVALAGLAGFAGGRLAPWPTLGVILALTYTAPLLVLAVFGRFGVEFLLPWSAALTGLLLADRERWSWSYPRAWHVPLVSWALVIAVAWPIIALREADFTSLALLARYNIPNTGIGGSPSEVIRWGIDTAIIHLLGLLWFDWLLRHGVRIPARLFRRALAWPLAAGAITGASLLLYQGAIDPTVFAVGVWVEIQRAAGPLLDANASGMLAALWTAGLVALATRGSRARLLALLALPVCWAGLWMSGSRTALATAVIGLVAAGASALWHARRAGRTLAAAVAVVALALAAVAVIAGSPGTSENPAERLRRTLPTELSGPALAAFAREMWNRNGYGLAATALIAERPLTGVGIGLFNLEGSAYTHAIGAGVPPDNAQNWWRHHVAELGFAGAAGLLAWTVVFVAFLARTAGTGEHAVPAAALKGALVGFGLASLVGMPAQSLPISLTFWFLAFWYARLVAPAPPPAPGPRGAPAWAWMALVALVATYATATLVRARGEDRPPMRAATGGWRYTYGMYDPGGAGRRRGPALDGAHGRHRDRKRAPMDAADRARGAPGPAGAACARAGPRERAHRARQAAAHRRARHAGRGHRHGSTGGHRGAGRSDMATGRCAGRRSRGGAGALLDFRLRAARRSAGRRGTVPAVRRGRASYCSPLVPTGVGVADGSHPRRITVTVISRRPNSFASEQSFT